jgi:hypothetical protein
MNLSGLRYWTGDARSHFVQRWEEVVLFVCYLQGCHQSNERAQGEDEAWDEGDVQAS